LPETPVSTSDAAAVSSPSLRVVGHWPHLRGKDSTPVIMWSVAAALVPALAAAGWFFGIRAYLHVGLAVATAVVTEALIQRLRGVRVTVGDGSAVVTGLLVAFCLPAQAGWYVSVVAALVAIAIAKQCFGGLGCNIWNPALVGRAFVHMSFGQDMNPSSYPLLTGGHFLANVGTVTGGLPEGVQAVTSARPMAVLKHVGGDGSAGGDLAHRLAHEGPQLWDLFVGNTGGAIGETSALLLLVGAAYLVVRGWARWQIPLAYVAVVALGALLLPLHAERDVAGGGREWLWLAPSVAYGAEAAGRFVAQHLLAGGLVLGAFFMATDMVTSPLTGRGLWIFGAGCGALTILIRLYSSYPEGVCFSILIMNSLVPLIDRYTQRRMFGHKR